MLLFFILTEFAFSQSLPQYLVNSKTLNMRSDAGKEFDIIGVLSFGDQVSIIEKYKNGWWLIEFQGNQGFVFSTMLKKDPNNGWNKRSYSSGETPECENVDPQYDFKIDNYLKVNVGSNTDVVIKLMKRSYSGDICIRIVYIRSNETYYVKNIPEGNYYLKIAYGSDWRQKIVDQKCYGKFMRSAQYEISKEKLDFNIIHNYDSDRVPSYELSLDIIVSRRTKPTFNLNNISEAEFNK